MFPVYRWLYNLVGFSRSQSNGFIILLPLIAAALFSEPVYRNFFADRAALADDAARLDSIVASLQRPDSVPKTLPTRVARLFDPNRSSREELIEMGFESSVASRIIKYRQAGGRFRTRPDLLKIHGIKEDFYKSVFHLISLPDSVEKTHWKKASPAITTLKAFDLNTADTTQFMELRGIGSKLSLRIIKYRQALGGFCRPEQVYEVYNLDSAVARSLIARSYVSSYFEPGRKNINSDTPDQLSAHPYISRKMAAALVVHRNKYGHFRSVEDLGKVSHFDSATLIRLKPYLTTGD